MKGLLTKVVDQAWKASSHTREQFAYRVLPNFLLEILTKYLRVESSGVSNLPKSGPCIVIANHSGYMGFDALMLGHQIHHHRKRIPKIVAHKLWFLRPEISVHAHKLGMVPATLANARAILEKKGILILFPEGEEGNFKPSRYRYRLRRFRRGFARLALQTGAPIIPATVVGAEETSLTLSQLRWTKDLVGIIIPIPLNVIPLPARWSIRFHEPILLDKDPELAEDLKHVTRISMRVRKEVQALLKAHVRERTTIFL